MLSDNNRTLTSHVIPAITALIYLDMMSCYLHPIGIISMIDIIIARYSTTSHFLHSFKNFVRYLDH